MYQLALVYGGWHIVQKVIDSIDSLTFYTIYERYQGDGQLRIDLPMNQEEIIFVPESVDPMSIPEFLMCFNNKNPSTLYNKLAWVIQGTWEKLQSLERFNPNIIVDECEDTVMVIIDGEIRQIDIEQPKIPVTLYVRPKSNSAKRIIMDIMPKMEIIKKRFDFTLNAIDDTDGNVPSAINATPALVTPDGIIYTSEAILKFFK